jgi:hypothetical protein
MCHLSVQPPNLHSRPGFPAFLGCARLLDYSFRPVPLYRLAD